MLTYSYNADGQRVGMTDGTGSSSWTYNSLLEEVSYTDGASATVGYGYDRSGNQTSITYPGGGVVTQGYNAANEMTSIKDQNGNTSTFTYDASGNLTGESLPNGVTGSYTYDHAGNLTGIADTSGSTQVFSASYGYNANNMVASDSSQPSGEGSYQYTARSQLCYAAGSNSTSCSAAPSGATTYSYDAAGNLTGNNGTTQAFNSSDELCWGVTGSSSNSCGTAPTGATTYSYDANGNRTVTTPASGSATTLSWNGASELTGYTVGGSTVGYLYSGTGMRESRTAGSSTTQYSWNDSASVANPLLLEATTGGSSTSYVYGPTGAPLLEILPSGATYYYSGDNLGSTRVLTDASGAVVNSYSYSPYGSLSSSTGTVPNPLLYGGQYLDSGSGLYYLRARYYDPATAQFLSVDPLVQLTLSPYGYVQGNPVNAVDPSGELCWQFWNASQCSNALISTAVSFDHSSFGNFAQVWASGVTGGLSTTFSNWVQPGSVNTCTLTYATGQITGIATISALTDGMGSAAGEAGATTDGVDGADGGFDIVENNAGHIFRDATGHLAEDTTANRALLQEAANNPANYLSTDANGVVTYRQTLPDGTQVWAEVYNGQITNGGVNSVPR